MTKTRRPGGLRRDPQHGGAILDQGAIGFLRPIPFEHGEFGMMQFRPLAIAKDMGEGENPLFAGRQQFLAVEFRRAMQVIRRRRAARRTKLRSEAGDMGLVARRYLQRRRFDLDKTFAVEKSAQGFDDSRPPQQARTALSMMFWRPERVFSPHEALSCNPSASCRSRRDRDAATWRVNKKLALRGGMGISVAA